MVISTSGCPKGCNCLFLSLHNLYLVTLCVYRVTDLIYIIRGVALHPEAGLWRMRREFALPSTRGRQSSTPTLNQRRLGGG